MYHRIRVAVVDDHPLFRDGVIYTLSNSDELDLVAMGACRDDALRIVREDKPDILLLDIQLPGGGIEAAQMIAGMDAHTKIIILTASENENDVSAALEFGACGYVLKGISGRDLISTVCAVQKGDIYITPTLAARVLRSNIHRRTARTDEKTAFVLTPREEDILNCVSIGQTNKEIAIALKISEKTVKHYMTTIMHKLQVRNRVEAALKARQRQSN